MSKITQRLDQKQKFNPRQILEANLMQLNIWNLEKRILEEIENNPVLDVVEDEKLEEEQVEDESDFNWEDLVSNPEDYNIPSKTEGFDSFQNAHQSSIIEDFMFQLNDFNIQEDDLNIAELILGNIDERGYLVIEPILIADKLNIEESKVLGILNKIKKLEPLGIGSRTLQECLLVQLVNNYPAESIAINIVQDYFEYFKNNNISKIVSSLGCTQKEFNRAQEIISILNPSPALVYNLENVEHVIPDIIVEQVKGKWHVSMNSSFVPRLRLNNDYKLMLGKDKIPSDAKKFLKQKIDNANWFIGAVSSRYETMVKIMVSIMRHQKAYFDSDNRELIPLNLKTIAQDVDLDISTISRATNDKYVQLPWGCKEIKSFFSDGILTLDGDVVSNTIVKKQIADFIDNEDKGSPLTDQQIMEKLCSMKYNIARRTVSKYRESLQIPIARLRKKI
tara:strand:- start:1820 stop:3166 length:1347 start_codon:yes stop_codon:yes gene_type:complete